jgi:hypothetical protein
MHLPHLDILIYEVHVRVMKIDTFIIPRKPQTAEEN